MVSTAGAGTKALQKELREVQDERDMMGVKKAVSNLLQERHIIYQFYSSE